MKRQFFNLGASVIICAWALQFPATAIAKSKETVIFSFNNTSGRNSYASLIDLSGTLYGTTELGGVYGLGTVFSG